MFKDKGARNAINKLEEMIATLSTNVQTGKLDKNKYVECDKCGCLVKREKAIKQQTLEDKKYFNLITGRMENTGEKYIKTVYLCKHCLTKKK